VARRNAADAEIRSFDAAWASPARLVALRAHCEAHGEENLNGLVARFQNDVALALPSEYANAEAFERAAKR